MLIGLSCPDELVSYHRRRCFWGGTVVRSADQHNASSPLLEPAPRGRARLVLDRRSDPYIRSHSFVRSLHRLAALNYLLPLTSGHSAHAHLRPFAYRAKMPIRTTDSVNE